MARYKRGSDENGTQVLRRRRYEGGSLLMGASASIVLAVRSGRCEVVQL